MTFNRFDQKFLPFRRPLALMLLASVIATSFTSCATTSSNPLVAARNKIIAQEPGGNYFVGRRYHMPKTRWWGFLRKPGQPWRKARAVIMNESRALNPDRIPPGGAADGKRHGYDHNYEYIVKGSYTGRTLYDPNANIFIPEFRPVSYELRDEDPGFLFLPNEVYSETKVPIQAATTR